MDISSIVASARTVDIVHPATSEPIGLKITLLPESDSRVQDARRKWINERLHTRNAKFTAEKVEERTLSLIVAAVSGWDWSGEANFNGEQLTFSEPNLRKVLKALPWIREQIDSELGDNAAFFRNSASS